MILRVSGVDPPAATVIIATRDRRTYLSPGLHALAAQRTSLALEVIAVDDGSEPPLTPDDLRDAPMARLVSGTGRGPGEARNLGLRMARGEVVLVTDDDTLVGPAWLDAAVVHLAPHPDSVGVEGQIISLRCNPLYEISLQTRGPGAYYTVNVAYRRQTFGWLGGFRSDLFPGACEDADLAFRAEKLGPIGYCEAMVVRHLPRPIRITERIGRGRRSGSDVVLRREHPHRYGRAALMRTPLWALLNVTTTTGVWLAITGRYSAAGPGLPDGWSSWPLILRSHAALTLSPSNHRRRP